jgi:hypothetical protein
MSPEVDDVRESDLVIVEDPRCREGWSSIAIYPDGARQTATPTGTGWVRLEWLTAAVDGEP